MTYTLLFFLGALDLILEAFGAFCTFAFTDDFTGTPRLIVLIGNLSLDFTKSVCIICGLMVVCWSKSGITKEDRESTSTGTSVTQCVIFVGSAGTAIFIVVQLLSMVSPIIKYDNSAIAFACFAALKALVFHTYGQTVKQYVEELPTVVAVPSGYPYYSPVTQAAFPQPEAITPAAGSYEFQPVFVPNRGIIMMQVIHCIH